MTEKIKHKWECVSVGEYDSLYQCKSCGDKFMEVMDYVCPKELPKFGCKKQTGETK